jgi:hypothetical protein
LDGEKEKQGKRSKEVREMIIGNYMYMFYEILLISAVVVVGGYLIGFLARSKFSRAKSAGRVESAKCGYCGSLVDGSGNI